jgi:D-galactarolactone cycloisomerase
VLRSIALRRGAKKERSMKVTDVVCHFLQSKVDKPFTSARGWLYSTRSSCVVEIRTDDGVTGWGECYGPAAVAKAAIDTQLAARVKGRDPFDVEVIWEDLYNRVKDYGLTGITIAAISGIDIALWDIMGRATGKPVHKLIGGACRDQLVPYATGLYFIDMARLTERRSRKRRRTSRRDSAPSRDRPGRPEEGPRAWRRSPGDRPGIRLAVDANHSFGPQRHRLGMRRARHPLVRDRSAPRTTTATWR